MCVFQTNKHHSRSHRELLRIKRSVAASFSTVHFNAPAAPQVAAEVGDKRKREEGVDEMAALEQQQEAEQGTRVAGFVSAGIINSEQYKEEAANKAKAAAANPEDIALDEEEEEGEPQLEAKPVPAAVFGGVSKTS